MKIAIKVGNVEIEYSEPMRETQYPKIISKDSYENITKSERMFQVISDIAHTASEIYEKQFTQIQSS